MLVLAGSTIFPILKLIKEDIVCFYNKCSSQVGGRWLAILVLEVIKFLLLSLHFCCEVDV